MVKDKPSDKITHSLGSALEFDPFRNSSFNKLRPLLDSPIGSADPDQTLFKQFQTNGDRHLNISEPNRLVPTTLRYDKPFDKLQCAWSGALPSKTYRNIVYSPKVFLGGLPWDISEQSLINIFKPFGTIK